MLIHNYVLFYEKGLNVVLFSLGYKINNVDEVKIVT